MKRSIRVSAGRTINLGNFNSAKIEIDYSREILDGEDPEEAIDEEYEFVTEIVEKKELEIREELK
jgi:hypothetical protein